jgi:thiosulfate/3-mercaptopyruvate sulfurtransferase
MNKKWLSIVTAGLVATMLLGGCGQTSNEEAPQEAPASVEQAETTAVAEESESSKSAKILVSVEALQAEMAEKDLILLDTRGKDAYDGGHIPGAIAISWQELSNMSVDFATPTWGSVVDSEALGQMLGKLGIDGSKPVVLYADTEKGWGEDGRVLWTLNMAGIEDVRILDGGINLWNDKEGQVTTEATEVTAVTFEIGQLDMSGSIDTDALASQLLDYKVLDTRDYDEYEGAIKFGEARGGHLPGAIHLAYKSLLNDDGSLKSDAELEAIFAEAGLEKGDKIATYCTAGIRSAYVAEILQALGYENAVNYDESFYIWANTPELKLGRVVKGAPYNYYTQDDLKVALESKAPMTLVDIQPAEDFASHHIAGAVETNAFPAKTAEERAKLDGVIETIKGSSDPVVIVCPRGGGGAQNTFAYMLESGIPSAQIYILEKGQEGWPYDELLAK